MREEDALQSAICDYLDLVLTGASWWCAVPNGSVLAGNAAQRGRQMNRLKRTGLKVGCPDLIICSEGRFIGVEVKSAKGKLSESQKDVSDLITQAGGLWTVVRSVDELDAYLRLQGVPMRRKL